MGEDVCERLEQLFRNAKHGAYRRKEGADRDAAEILYCRFCAPERLTLRAIGVALELSTERVRQIQEKALRIMRHPVRRSEVIAICRHYPKLAAAVFAGTYNLEAAKEAIRRRRSDGETHE